MTKVITYGTYDLLHYGHIKLLERAKALGDYLIVGITADDFDMSRGKINVQQTLIERIEAVRNTGLADEIIVEEYEGQKIDDIKRYNIDVFTVGSDWKGKFDYLEEFCRVVYLDRTQGVSSSEIRAEKNELKIGFVGESSNILDKYFRECSYVNGIRVIGIFAMNIDNIPDTLRNLSIVTNDYSELLKEVDAVYIISHPSMHYEHIKKALELGKHVLCESPVCLETMQCDELYELAEQKDLVFSEAIKTAFSTAYNRMILLAKGGKIGDIVSVDAVCTSLREIDYLNQEQLAQSWNSLTAWGPTALLPIFQLLGTDYVEKRIISRIGNKQSMYDEFTKISFLYPHAVASVKVGNGVKSEGELIVSGTEGYIYVPAPWWKTDYFEIRYENPQDTKRYFYQLDGEGIRYEIVTFVRNIERLRKIQYIDKNITRSITSIMQDYNNGDVTII